MPLFSVVVPTRNRPVELETNLRGLGQLDFSDVEIIVSDNSGEECARVNEAVFNRQSFPGTARLVRPGRELNMVDHWNFALSQATGEYIGIVTDRMTLLPHSLSAIAGVIKATGTDCISYPHTNLSWNARSYALHPPLRPVKAERMSSAEVVRSFANSKFTKNCPRLLNSFTSQSAMSKIRSVFGSVVGGIAPDYNFLFRYLATHDTYVHIDRQFLADHSPASSNGMAVTRNRNNLASSDFIARMLDQQKNDLAVGPIPQNYRIGPNVILRELLICVRDAGPVQGVSEVAPGPFYALARSKLKKFVRFNDPGSSEIIDDLEQYRVKNGLSALSALKNLQFASARLSNTLWARGLRRATNPAGGSEEATARAARVAAILKELDR